MVAETVTNQGLKSFKKNVKDEGVSVAEDGAKAIETEAMRDGAAEPAARAGGEGVAGTRDSEGTRHAESYQRTIC